MLTPSIVISQRLAQRLFNGASAALGAHVVLNSTDYVVIGVAGPQWDVPSWKTDVWESSAFAHARRPQCCSVQLLGRLKRDVTIAQARADVADAARVLATADSKTLGRLHTDGDDAARQATGRRQARAAAPLGRRGNRFDRRVREYCEPARRA